MKFPLENLLEIIIRLNVSVVTNFINNIQFVHKDINLMKNQLDEDYFVALCGLITEHSK